MPQHDMFHVDAFTSRLFHGNPAAVLVLDAPLPEEMMQSIAAENSLPETAFVEVNGAGWSIRWFTPAQEVAFCGHATLAAAHVLVSALGHGPDLRFSTREVGDLQVRHLADDATDHHYELNLPILRPEPVETPPEAFKRLFPNGYRAVFRNFENLFVELNTAAEVAAFIPNFDAIREFAPFGLGITAPGGTTHVGAPVDFVSRYFAPSGGIDEDPVTGSAHTTLLPYWADRLQSDTLLAFQASKRGGLIECRLAKNRVYLTGSAVTYARATLLLP